MYRYNRNWDQYISFVLIERFPLFGVSFIGGSIVSIL